MPNFVWFGILGLILLWAAGIVMLLVKQRNMVHLRSYHPLLGSIAAISLAVHAVWANLTHLGHSMPLFGWVGLVAVGGVLFGYFAISRARKTGDPAWRQVHVLVELASLVLATAHAFWFITRILGR